MPETMSSDSSIGTIFIPRNKENDELMALLGGREQPVQEALTSRLPHPKSSSPPPPQGKRQEPTGPSKKNGSDKNATTKSPNNTQLGIYRGQSVSEYFKEKKRIDQALEEALFDRLDRKGGL